MSMHSNCSSIFISHVLFYDIHLIMAVVFFLQSIRFIVQRPHVLPMTYCPRFQREDIVSNGQTTDTWVQNTIMLHFCHIFAFRYVAAIWYSNWSPISKPVNYYYLQSTFRTFAQRFHHLLQSIRPHFQFQTPTMPFSSRMKLFIQCNNLLFHILIVLICFIIAISLLITFWHKYRQ